MADTSDHLGCSYAGYDFGAGYQDSTCIDGYLWDADSCDEPGGPLYEGGDIPCPRCNTIRFLERALGEVKDGGCGMSMTTPWCAAIVWEHAVKKALRENSAIAKAWLAALAPFETDDWPDRRAVYRREAAWDRTVARRWPWPMVSAEPALVEEPPHG